MNGLFSPEGGWRVRIKDLSGGAEDGVVEDIGGFPSLMQANEFARRYVRDSIEHCREAAMNKAAVLERWHSFGEDAEVLDSDQDGWQSRAHIDDFAAEPATREERDWRVLDPRQHALHQQAQDHADTDFEDADGDHDVDPVADEDEV